MHSEVEDIKRPLENLSVHMYITNALLEGQVSQVNDCIRRVCLNHSHPLYLGVHAICYFCIMV